MKKLTDTKVLLKWTADRFVSIGMFTGFGYSGVALLNIIQELRIPVHVYFIDTGFHFDETYNFARLFNANWISLNEDMKELILKEFENPWELNSNLCCHFFKVEPMLRVLPNHQIWIDALRKEQTEYRKNLISLEVDGRGTLKLHPFLEWTSEEVWEYIKFKNLQTNPLHDRGYMSIGCKHCTSPVRDGGDEREGRWKDSLKKECGLHL